MSERNRNPYVGPRPFLAQDWELFYGRDREADDLLSLILADRLVLFYAPSGAGKSSLINTSLCRGLEGEDFYVLPVIRIGGDVPGEIGAVDNIFIFNLISNLDQEQHDAGLLARMTLDEYLQQFFLPLSEEAEKTRRVLIIDQFEEIVTSHAEAWPQREDFFRQLRQSMTIDPQLWVVLAVREENVAVLDRYKNLLSGGLRTRFYMQSLTRAAALEAIKRPAIVASRPFAPGVAEELVDNLSLIWKQNHEYFGEFVEPVQLQVVCYQLWEELKAEPRSSISLEDLQRVAGTTDLAHFVDRALARFYEDGIRRTRAAVGLPELDLRDWFGNQMITEAGTRNLVFRGVEKTGGLPNQAVDQLATNLLIRTEERAAGTWYELIHDRLIQPIRDANLAWYQEHPLIMLAYEWDKAGRAAGKLLEGERLQDALASDWRDLGSLVSEFLNASQMAQAAKDREQQEERQHLELEHQRALTKEQKTRVFWLSIASSIAFLSLIGALFFAWRATSAEYTAEIRSARLLASEAQQATTTKPQLSLLLALEAVKISPQVDSRPVVTETLQTLQQALSTTTSYPLRGLDMHVITNVVRIATSPDGKWLAAGSQSGMLHLWNLTAGEPDAPQVSLHLHNSAVTALTFSPDGHWLSTGGQDAVINIFDLTATNVVSSKLMIDASGDAVTALAFYPTTDPAKTWLAVGHTDSVVQRIDLPTADPPRVSALLGEPSRATKALAFSSDSKWLATVDITDTLRVWPLATTALPSVSPLLSKDKNDVLAFSPDGQWLATASTNGTTIYLYKLEDLDTPPFPLLGSATGEQAIGFSPDGRLLATGGRDGIVRLWSLDSLSKPETKTTVQVGAVPSSAPTIPARPSEWSKTTITPIELPQRPGAVSALVFGVIDKGDAGGMWLLATASADPIVELWNIDDLTAPWSLLYGHDVAVKSVSIAEQFSLVFAESQDGTIRTWNLVAQRHAPKDLNQLMNELPMWVTEACQRAGREFSASEWAEYFGDSPVKPTCADEKITSGQ